MIMAKFCIYEDDIQAIERALGLIYGKPTEKIRALQAIEKARTYYAVAGISKADVAGKLFEDVDKAEFITDDDMDDLIRMMENNYLDQLYWSQIDILGEDIKRNVEERIEADREA